MWYQTGLVLGWMAVARKKLVNRVFFICVLLVAFFWPGVSWAHALNAAYFPLGRMPIQLAAEWWPCFVLIPIRLAVETLVLWAWVRRLGFWGNAWRAGLLYIVAIATEEAMLLMLQPIPLFRYAGWYSSAAKNFTPLVLLVLGGLMFAALLGLLIYRRLGLSGRQIVIAVCTSSLAGYLSALGCGLLLVN